MPIVAAWGETITVLMELGFPVNVFTLNSATDGILDEDFLDGTLVGDDVAAYVQDIRITRGRQDQLANFSAGSCSITLLNNDRRFDPTNENSPYWNSTLGQSGVTPRRKVTVRLGGQDVFVGRITDIDLSYATGKSTDLSTVTVNAADDFVLLANTATTEDRTPTEELSGARLAYLLELPEINYTDTTNIDDGTATLGAYTIASNTNALQYAQAIAESEQGYFFVSRDGIVTFTDRVSKIFGSSVADFSDDDGTDIKYQTLSVIYGQEFLYNKVLATRQGGTPQVANDATSQAEYGISTLNLDGLLLASDVAAQTLADDLLDLYSEPAYRFDGMSLLVSAQSSAVRTTLNTLELGDTVTVERNYQTGSPAQVVKYQTVERLNRVINPNVHRLEIAMSDAFIVFPFVLNDAVRGVLDDPENALS
jgi:hypothetical protein